MTADELRAGLAALQALRPPPGLSPAVLGLAIGALRERLAQLERDAAAQVDGERRLRQVTVMFVDTVGSTALAARLDPEEHQSVMDGALARFTANVRRHGGQVLQYTGDGLLAAFGTEQPAEDDAERAVHAGLAILADARAQADALRGRLQLDALQARVGLHTGPVLLGGGVDGSNTIRGLTVSLAARMEQHAPSGGLRASAATLRLVQGLFEVDPQPPLRIKGSETPMATGLVRRRRPRALAQRARGVAGLPTPLVGREAVLAALLETWRGLSCGTATLLRAEAGVGKSRLLAALAERAQARRTPADTAAHAPVDGAAIDMTPHPGGPAPASRWLHVAALPTMTQQPYALLRTLLAALLDLPDLADAPTEADALASAGDSETARLRERFGAAVRAQLPDPADAADADVLGQLLGLDFADSPQVRGIAEQGAQIRSRGLHLAGRLLASSAGRAALAVVLDDLHWCDAPSMAAWPVLLQACADLPLWLLGSARPEIDALHPAVTRTPWQPLTLPALGAADAQTLADALLAPLGPDRPADLGPLLIARAEGNPYCMEEWVQMLLDQGALQPVDADTPGTPAPPRWRWVPERAAPDTLPVTLADVLQARLSLLPAPACAALEAAAVAGLEFAPALWTAIAPEAPAQRAVLVERGLLQPADGGRLRFQHHLLQRAAAARMLKPDRRRAHGRAGDWHAERARLHGETGLLALAADHYEQAERAFEACEASLLAAEHLATRFAHADVVAQASRGLRLAGPRDAERRWRLLAVRQRALRLQGQAQAHQDDLDAMQALADASGDVLQLATVAVRRAGAFQEGGDPARAVALAPTALALAERSGHPSLALTLLSVWAGAARTLGDLDTARRVAEDGLTRARAAGASAIEGELLVTLATVRMVQGDAAGGERLLLQALAIDRALGNLLGQCTGLINLGVAAQQGGDFATAQDRLDEAGRLADRLGRRLMQTSVQLNLSALALARGDGPAAAGHARQALAMSEQDHHAEYAAYARLSLGMAELAIGRHADACGHLRAAHAALEAQGLGHAGIEAVAGLAQAALETDDLATAQAETERLLDHESRHGGFEGTERPLMVRWVCLQVLRAADDPRHGTVLQRAWQALQQQAALLPDDLARRRALQAHPHHAQIASAAAAAGLIPGGS